MNNPSYFHIIGNKDIFDNLDTCIYLDGISRVASLGDIIDTADRVFSSFGKEITQILVSDSYASNPRVRSIKWLRRASEEVSYSEHSGFHSLEFFPTKRRTIDETWRPEIYLSVTFGRKTNSIFFSVRNGKDRLCEDFVFKELSGVAEFCAGYIFEFPSKFSSMAYYWGIVMDPAGIPFVRFGEREALRLEVWRSNTEIGISKNDARKFYSVCDGYVRDVYPTMILSKCHIRREINGKPLIDFIAKSLPVSVEHIGNQVWLYVQNDRLGSVQRSFDENELTLSAEISLG
jgi:hypothetical protein